MGFFSYTIAGGGFILIGAWESIASTNPELNPSAKIDASSPLNQKRISVLSSPKRNPSSSSVTFVAVSALSLLFILNSLFSFFDALNSNDGVGSADQLQVLAIACLFFFYSVSGFFVNWKNSFPFSVSLPNLIALFGFLEEFILFYMQKKNPSGIENRYFDLLLVPISICVFSTVLELKSPRSNFPKLARGVGLILHGSWFIQMAFSFYTNWISHGCFLHEKNRGNFTVKCKGHPDYHRARAIATLQFNCHLALLVVLTVGLYSMLAKRHDHGNFSRYRPLGGEMQQMENVGHFTLDSDEDDQIREEDKVMKKEPVDVEMVGVNGFGSH